MVIRNRYPDTSAIRVYYIIDSHYICGVLKIICDERVESAARYNISRRDYRRLCGREAIMMSRNVKTNKKYLKTDEVFAKVLSFECRSNKCE